MNLKEKDGKNLRFENGTTLSPAQSHHVLSDFRQLVCGECVFHTGEHRTAPSPTSTMNPKIIVHFDEHNKENPCDQLGLEFPRWVFTCECELI